ncbi:MAG: TIGR03792 family protein [Synechococcus sp. TMED19]|nr:MAG: TIGR03792 family protein [Synechococcus sp. TMED19]
MSWLAALLSLLLLASPVWAMRPLDPAAGVVEVLHMPVSNQQRQCWLQAEADHWEPWLEQQHGYRGRELLWDPDRQQAVVLIGWQSQGDWDAIPTASISTTEEAFDAQLRQCLGTGNTKPLPLQLAGAMQPLMPISADE